MKIKTLWTIAEILAPYCLPERLRRPQMELALSLMESAPHEFRQARLQTEDDLIRQARHLMAAKRNTW
jgi:hypothetical protein